MTRLWLWICLFIATAAGADDATCARLRVPPASVEYELVHVASFADAYHQARKLVAAWHLAAYKTPNVSSQLLDALTDMAQYEASEALVNLTLDHTLVYDVTVATDANDPTPTSARIVLRPEEAVAKTVVDFCDRWDVVDCNALYTQLYALVVRDWGCQDDDEKEEEQEIKEAIASVEDSETALPNDKAEDQRAEEDASALFTVLRVRVGNETQNVTINPDLDLELQSAVLCRQWKTPLHECANLLQVMRNLTQDHPASRRRNPASSWGLTVEITDPVPSRLHPISERVQFDGQWFDETLRPLDGRQRVCLLYGYDPTPQICGLFPPEEMWYFKRDSLLDGYHIVFFTTEDQPSSVLAARHFWVVTPTVQLVDVHLRALETTVLIVLELETTAFDVGDSEFRVCALLDDVLECFDPARFHIQTQSGVSHQRRTVVRVPMFGVDSGQHTVSLLLLNSFNKAIAHSRVTTFEVTVEPTRTLEPRNPVYFLEPPSAGHRERPAVCPPSLQAAELDWICHLWRHEWGRFSQNGEDGILQSIFYHIGVTNRFYVEFGTEDARECNTRLLREAHDWSGLLLDGGHANANINLHREWISPENINELFVTYAVPRDFDLLSIDVDFNDYWILDAIDRTRFSPRVLMIEVNSHVPPTEPRVVQYRGPSARWDGTTAYFGVSVGAMHLWGQRNGYSLVYCESHGVNCFLIRDDVLAAVTHGNDDDDLVVVSEVLSAEDLFARPNFFGRNVSYPWPTRESGIVQDWFWLDA